MQERQRERDRYNEYMDEQDNESLPNAFNHGWRKNMVAVMGPSPSLWMLPICNSLGDGWTWEPSEAWQAARDSIKKRRMEESRRAEMNGDLAGNGQADPYDLSSDEEDFTDSGRRALLGRRPPDATGKKVHEPNWNDIPEDMFR
jgi:hypothetical protein